MIHKDLDDFRLKFGRQVMLRKDDDFKPSIIKKKVIQPLLGLYSVTVKGRTAGRVLD